MKLPDGSVRLVEPAWAGKLSGFTLLFEALEQADFWEVRQLSIDETSKARGHQYVTIAADPERRAVTFVTETREAAAIEHLAEDLGAHGGDPLPVAAVSINISPASITGVAAHLPNAAVTFDKYHVIAHASRALDQTRRREHKRDPALEGVRWTRIRMTNGFIEVLNGLFQAAKRTARGYRRLSTIRTVIFMIAGKLNVRTLNPHAFSPLGIQKSRLFETTPTRPPDCCIKKSSSRHRGVSTVARTCGTLSRGVASPMRSRTRLPSLIPSLSARSRSSSGRPSGPPETGMTENSSVNNRARYGTLTVAAGKRPGTHVDEAT